MSLPNYVKMVEVSPRDGLQNESRFVPTAVKIDYINRLSATGLKTIEVTSFVSAAKIPQLSDSAEVYSRIEKHSDITYPVLVPNLQGLENALKVNVKEIAVFTAASNTFTQKNINCSIEESLNRIKNVVRLAKSKSLKIRGYISCALGCPYEGDISPKKVADLAKILWDMGIYEISLGDTIGIGTPAKTLEVIESLIRVDIPLDAIAVHFHDTYGQALANIYVALKSGVHVIDCSVAGIGGCPYAKGATGNVASEDVLYLLNGLGIETGVNLEKLIQVGNFITDQLQIPNRSKVAMAKITCP